LRDYNGKKFNKNANYRGKNYRNNSNTKNDFFDENKTRFSYKYNQEGEYQPYDLNVESSWTPSFVEDILRDYRYSICKKIEKPVKLSFFYKNEPQTRSDYKKFCNQMTRALWLSDPNNEDILKTLCKRELQRSFPKSLKTYSIDDDYLFSDVPQDEFSKAPETFVFVHSDDYLQRIISAPKIPLTGWKTVLDRKCSFIQTKMVAFKVGRSCMIGEISKYTNKSCNYIKKNSNSSLRFCAYACGEPQGKFMVERWDYEPVYIHFNKFDDKGRLDIDGYYCQKTRHSHSHYSSLRQRLFFTQNLSADVVPTAINRGTNPEEICYETFEDMSEDFERYANCIDAPIPDYEDNFYLKDYIEKNCPIAIRNGILLFHDDQQSQQPASQVCLSRAISGDAVAPRIITPEEMQIGV
jgi:hypothetical protein